MTNGNKVRINNKSQIAIKEGVSKNEKNGFKLVYPNSLNNGNSLLKGKKIIKNGDKFTIHMKILEPLEKLGWYKLEYTNNALNMLEKQFERLHEQRPHTDFNVTSVNEKRRGGSIAPSKSKNPWKQFETLVRQILVERNKETGKVIKMYLTDFEKHNTPNHAPNKRKNLEKILVDEFIRTIKKNKSPVKRPWNNSTNGYNSNSFQTPPPIIRSQFRTPSPNGKSTARRLGF